MNFPQWFEKQFLEWQLKEGGRKTVHEFAAFLGVSQPTVSTWLNGTREPTGKNVDKIAEKLDHEVYEILGLRTPKIYNDPQLAQLLATYEQATAEQKAELLRQALRLIGYEPES